MGPSTQIEKINDLAAQALYSCEFRCSKVSFDLYKIKKPDAVYKTYHIQNGERIIAFSKATLSLISITIDGVVFTNKALYLHPNSARNIPNNRFAYSDLCKYIITQEDDHGSVHMQNKGAEYKIYDSTLIFKNTAGKEILYILETIQAKLLSASSSAQAQYNEQAQWALALGRSEMNHGMISARVSAILDVLRQKSVYSKDAAFLIAENVFRLCDRSQYQKSISKLVENLSPNEFKELEQTSTQFMENFLKQLSDINHEFTEDLLSKVQNNIDRDYNKLTSSFSEFFDITPFDEPYFHVMAYCAIRRNDVFSSQKAIAIIRKKFGEEQIHKIEYFKGIHHNRQMLEAYKALHAGKEIDKSWFSFCDSFDLTLLHYALILKNEAVQEKALTILKSFRLPKAPDNENIHWMYDYPMLACGTQSAFATKVLQYFDPNVRAHEKNIIAKELLIKQYDVRLKSMDLALDKCKKEIQYVVQTGNLEYDLFDLHHNQENIQSQIVDLQCAKRDAEEDLECMKRERIDIMQEATATALEKLDRLNHSNDPLGKFLFRVYFEPAFLYSVLIATSDQINTRLYKYNDLYFVAPDFAELDSTLIIDTESSQTNDSNSEEQLKLDGFVPIIPPHGTSWFSANARSDATVLKTEYRALVKRYHPDVCPHPDSNTAMQQITAEYEDLLNHI